MRNVFTYETGIEIRDDPSVGSQRGPGTNQKRRKQRRSVKKGRRRARKGGEWARRGKRALKSGPAIKRANYPPSHKCTPSNIFFLRSLREHSKRTQALAYASCISRRRARIMPCKSPRMHIIYGSGSCIESARGSRGT